MEFDLQWLLWGLPLAFGLGWLASRLDVRQWKREQRSAPKAYFQGLNLLLNEQQDKAIDAFIEAVQQDPDTSELHFALGNLFRRRGEYERAVRVHEHLLKRGDLPLAERQRAQHGLAQDFMKAGLFDRAEAAWQALEGTAYDTEARLALLTLHERSHDWRSAVDDASKLERSGTGTYTSRIAHYWCELALEADAAGRGSDADAALLHARGIAPQAARPLVQAGLRAARLGQPAEALTHWHQLLSTAPASFSLVAEDFASASVAVGRAAEATAALQAHYALSPSLDVLRALALTDPDPARQAQRLTAHLERQPSLSAARAVLALHTTAATPGELALVEGALAAAAKPLQRYRCAACGFEAQHYFWQCPGCLNWDTYPPQRLEDL